MSQIQCLTIYIIVCTCVDVYVFGERKNREIYNVNEISLQCQWSTARVGTFNQYDMYISLFMC